MLGYTAILYPGESVSITLDGKTTNIPSDAPNFEDLCKLVRAHAPAEDVKAILSPADKIKTLAAEAGFEIRLNETTSGIGAFFNGVELNNKVSELIIDLFQAGNDFKPLANFLVKALSNRDAKEADILYDFVIKNKLPLHPDGDFLAFKATRADGFDMHSGTVQYRIGEYVIEAHPDMNKNTQCGRGLHIGGRNYVDGYGRHDSAYWLLKVNPADTIFYRADVNDGKMRVNKVFVYAQIAKPDTLETFLPFMIASSPEGDVLEKAAKKSKPSKKLVGKTAKVATQAPKARGKDEKKAIKQAKKSQSFVTKQDNQTKFTARDGKSYTTKEIVDGVKAHGQRGFAALTGVARTTIQGWLDAINGVKRDR